MAVMFLVFLLFGAALVGAEDVNPHEMERLEAALESAAKEGSRGLKRVARQDDDPFYSLPKTHHLFHPPPPPAPVNYNPPPVHYNPPPPPQPPPPQQPPSWPIRPPPSVPCIPSSGTQITDGSFAIPHSPSSYSASLPYISGYRLIPIIGQKHIVVNDITHVPGPAPCVEGFPSQVSYVQQVYSHNRQAEDLLKPFEDAGYFAQPPDASHQLRSVREYQDKIDDLNNHVEHLESLKENAALPKT